MLKPYQYKFIKPPTPEQEANKRTRLALAYEFYKTHKEECEEIVEAGIIALKEGRDYNASFVTKKLKSMGYSGLGFSGRDLIKILDGKA